eukprot:CAMPEP_0171327082 /NCGR_PEP_ID=MMETSP0816-20121228/117853_1 /TAXON_ID=420281 /ORGANISM="Proboscia inermis, Strain CCAP1064/1" /LENGTH=47 /DNA_ID= /DNA_START= /DNA_END= /DNA_ORIENTATION=
MAARPLFYALTQRITQWLTDHEKIQATLPVRVLVPVSYTTIRLALIW